MSSITKRARGLIKARTFLTFASALLSCTLAVMVTGRYSDQFNIAFLFFAGLIGAWGLHKIVCNVGSFFLALAYYGTDSEGLVSEMDLAIEEIQRTGTLGGQVAPDSGKNLLNFSMKIVGTPPEHYGKYLDIPFYEWLDISFEGDPAVFRFTFNGTMDFKKGIGEIPPGHLLLPPGILYAVPAMQVEAPK